jgi:Uma2 family endonuclease
MNLALSESGLPVCLRFERPMTDEEFLRFCAENDPLRVERNAQGELIVMSPTGSAGGGVETDVTVELSIWARQDGRGKVFGSNAGFTLPDGSVRAADSHWVSWPRWNALSSEDQKRFAPICPEFVIEVRSETDKLHDLQAKMEMWIANGAEVAWLIDPLEKAVVIYRPGEQPEVLAQPTSVQGTGPIAGFELVLARIWA